MQKLFLFFMMGLTLSFQAQATYIPDEATPFGDKVFLIDGDPIIAPEFQIITPNGETSLADMKGQVTLVVFWATWCHVCLREMPEVNALAEKMAPEGLRVVPLSLDSGHEDAFVKIDNYNMRKGYDHLPVYVDPDRMNAAFIGLRGTPTSIVLNKQGHVVASLQGYGHWNTPEAYKYLRSLLAE